MICKVTLRCRLLENVSKVSVELKSLSITLNFRLKMFAYQTKPGRQNKKAFKAFVQSHILDKI